MSSDSAPLVSASSTSALLTWEDPVASAKVFGTLVAALVLVKVNVVPFALHVLYFGLLASAAAEYAGKLVVGEGFVTKYLGKGPKAHTETFRTKVLPVIGDAAGSAEAYIHKVVFAQDIESTLKAAGVAYILHKFTLVFSIYSLLCATVLLAFSVPPFYQANKKEIDAAVAQYTKVVKDKSAEYTALAHKKAAPHIDAISKKSGPLGSFIQSKFPTRTAGSTVNSPTAPVAATSAEPATGVSTGASFPSVPQTSPSGVSEVAPEINAEAPMSNL